MAWFYIFVGGGIGSMLRYQISEYFNREHWALAYGTLLANLIACVILGLLLGYHSKHGIETNQKLLLMTGFCGGFSTFSTFSAEIVNQLLAGSIIPAIVYVLLSVVLGIIAVYIGVVLIK